MILETLGTVKILSALKCGVTGVVSAIPTLINNSVVATEQMAAVVTPIAIKGATAAGHGAIAVGSLVAKGLVAAKTGAASLGAKLAGGTAATAVPAAKGALGTSLAVPTSGRAIVNGVIKSVSLT